MTEWQRVLVALISEIDAVCEDLGIDYCSADRLAWDTVKYQKFHDKTYDAYLAIRQSDSDALLLALESKSDRICEHYEREEVKYIRYVDKSTILIDLDAPVRFKELGIAVTIRLLADPDHEGLIPYRIGEKSVRLAPEVFFPAKRGTFEKQDIAIPGDSDAYFTALVSSRWQDNKYPHPINRVKFPVFVDSEYGYEKLLGQSAVQKALSFEQTQQREAFLHMKREIAPLTRKAESYKTASTVSYWRFQFWEMYYPQRSQIKEYLEAEDVEALTKILGPCIVEIEKYLKHGIGLYFDPDIHQALVLVCQKKYGDAFVEKWTAAIPESHYEDVASVLRREGIAHPLLSS